MILFIENESPTCVRLVARMGKAYQLGVTHYNACSHWATEGGNHRTGCIEALGSKRHELFTLPMGTSVNRRYVARIWLKGTDEGGRHTPIALRAGMHYTCPVFFTNVPQLKGSGFELPILF